MTTEVEELLDRCEAALRRIEAAIAGEDWEGLETLEVELPSVTATVPPEFEPRLRALLDATLGLERLVGGRLDAIVGRLERTARQRRAARAYLGR